MASHGISQGSVKPGDPAVKAAQLTKHREQWERLVARRQSRDPYGPDALNLTSDFLRTRHQAEFYTVWNYRREILQDLMKAPEERYRPPPEHADGVAAGAEVETRADAAASQTPVPPRPAPAPTDIPTLLKNELKFTIPLIQEYPKTYVLWHQRLWLLQQANARLPAALATKFWRGELELVHMLLARDARNFHGWMYRRLVVAEIERLEQREMTQEEWAYTVALLRAGGQDENLQGRGLRNYSAWWRRGGLMGKLPGDWQSKVDLLEDELELVKRAIVTDVEDQSLWLHYRWLVTSHCEKDNKTAVVQDMDWSMRAGLLGEEIEWLQELRETYPDCKYLLLALINHIRIMWRLRKEPHDPEDEEQEEEVDEEKERREIWDWIQTLKRIDPMRRGRYSDLELDIFPLGYSATDPK